MFSNDRNIGNEQPLSDVKSPFASLTRAAVLLLALAVSPACALSPADIAALKQEGRGPVKEARTDPPKPTAHRVQNVEGWTVRVDERLFQPTNKATLERGLKFLDAKLADIKLVARPEIVTKLQTVVIVLDLTHGKLRSMQYHPDLDWLQANGYSTNLVKCVHIPEISDLVTSRNVNEQPWVILHELAHAYHDQVLGFEEPRILKAYEDYKKSGHGDQALLYNGSRVRHYGLTDQKEFFAEMTESYFGMDDFFPFNRAELMTAEPDVYELMRAIWEPVAGQRPASPRAKPSSGQGV